MTNQTFKLGETECTPANTAVFTYLGEMASRNHLFVTQEAQGEHLLGSFVFSSNPGVIEKYAAFMIQNAYECHLNQREVRQCDESAYQKFANMLVEHEVAALPDEIPAEWLNASE